MMDENELFEAFGVEQEPGENEREAADPADVTVTGENGQEPAQPAENQEEPTQEMEDPAPMDEEERHRQAQLRRETERAERDQATAAAVDQAFATAYAGKLNPYTGKPITGKADFEQYKAQLADDQRRQQMDGLRASGVDPAVIEGIVSNHPVIQQAQTLIEAAQAAEREAVTTQARAWYESQVKEIQAIDPEVKSLNDLAQRDPGQYRQMLAMVERGVPMADAYKALNFDALAQKRAAAAQQTVRNQTAGKAHLTASGGQGKAGVEVPTDVRAMYRDLNPDMTDAQISAAYAEYVKETQK